MNSLKLAEGRPCSRHRLGDLHFDSRLPVSKCGGVRSLTCSANTSIFTLGDIMLQPQVLCEN